MLKRLLIAKLFHLEHFGNLWRAAACSDPHSCAIQLFMVISARDFARLEWKPL